MCLTSHITSCKDSLSTIIVSNMIFAWLPRLCTPTHTIICKVHQSSSEFQTQFQLQRPGRFSREVFQCSERYSKRRRLLVENITLNMVKIFITLWMVYLYTKSLQRYSHYSQSLLTQLPERKETAQGFHHEANGDCKIDTEFNGCDRRKLRMDQQHCSYSTILT
jgi:hypothetical protein